MLTSDQLDALVEPIMALYEQYTQSVINDIARRLAGMDFARPAAAWQMQRLTESGQVYESILDKLAQLTGKSETELRTMFQKAGVKALRFDDAIYRAAGLQPLPLNLSPAMAQVLAAGLRKTQGVMRNLTLTTALDGQNAFLQAADLAYMQVTSGAMSYNEAIVAGVKKVASDGLSVIQFPGRRDQLDVALRRTVLTGVNQTVGNLQIARADEMGVDLVQTSAHIGARNVGTGPANHESWQGRIFSRSGTSKKYPSFVEKTGYGTGPGLCGWNCRHSFYPFFEGISAEHYTKAELESYADKTVKYNGEEISFYDATQKQRAIERKIRYWKRQEGALKAAGLDASRETAKVRQLQAEMRGFTKQTGLIRQGERERVVVAGNLKPTRFVNAPITASLPSSSADLIERAKAASLSKIDFRSHEYQYVADLGDLGHLFSDDPGAKWVVPRPVIYNTFGSGHLTDKDHLYRLAWLEAHPEGLIKAIQTPDFVEKVLRVRGDGHYSITLITELGPGSKTDDRFMVVAVSLSKNLENGYHQTTTIYPSNWRNLFRADGTLRPKYKAVK